jgi:hypothetical protein
MMNTEGATTRPQKLTMDGTVAQATRLRYYKVVVLQPESLARALRSQLVADNQLVLGGWARKVF